MSNILLNITNKFSSYLMLRYICLVFVICFYSNANANAASGAHKINLSTDYFSKDFDVANYLDKIETSSIPESVQRHHIDYAYFYNNWIIALSAGNESGSVVRNVQPFEVQNKFSSHEVQISYLFDNRQQMLTVGLGQTNQDKISLDCVERRTVLLGGSCDGADFRLLDGDNFDLTGESDYLSVLTSDARQQHLYFTHAYFTSLGNTLVKLNSSIKYHYITHNTSSPLFALESDFLLDSEFKGQTLRSIIAELKDELPQESGWHDVVFEVNAEFKQRFENLEFIGSIGVLYSDKLNYEGLQHFKNNAFLSTGFQYRFQNNVLVGFTGKIYKHYLQGIQPILYTPKTSRFFAHPYGEISANLTYSF
jgi:hypothetical protein